MTEPLVSYCHIIIYDTIRARNSSAIESHRQRRIHTQGRAPRERQGQTHGQGRAQRATGTDTRTLLVL